MISITPTNAEVQLIEYPSEPSIFVAIDRLWKCYPEQTNNCSQEEKPKKRSAKLPTSESSGDQPQEPLRRGPVT